MLSTACSDYCTGAQKRSTRQLCRRSDRSPVPATHIFDLAPLPPPQEFECPAGLHCSRSAPVQDDLSRHSSVSLVVYTAYCPL